MPKLQRKQDKRSRRIALSSAGHVARGVGEGSRSSRMTAVIQQQVSETTWQVTDDSGSEYFPTPKKGRMIVEVPECSEYESEEEMEVPPNCLFFTELRALDSFMTAVSAYRYCRTEGCEGTLMPVFVERTGMGGGARVEYACSGCSAGRIQFDSSNYVAFSRRHVASLAVSLAFLLTGHTHAGYHNTLCRGLGIPMLHRSNFYSVVKDAYQYIKRMLDNLCTLAKDEMKLLPTATLGSWSRAVTTADGCWLTRGHFSQNCTFVVKNYLRNSILWYGHLCMRGNDDVVDEPLFPGTAKAAEGHLAELLFKRAKEEGCNVEINWQDNDSSAAKSVALAFPSAQIMFCAGHVRRAHTHRLTDLKAKKSFTAAYIAQHKDSPTVQTVRCCCAGKNHSAGCGCITEGFIRNARINHFLACLQAEKSASVYADRMRELGKYHARGVHTWDNGGSCSFHSQYVCSCGECDEELKCEGKVYESKNIVTCPLHSLAYEIECEMRARNAAQVIHSELGKGHSNLCESAFSVLPKFRAKNLALHRLTYMSLTNWGLVMSCQSFLQEKKGPEFSPYIELYKEMGLPIIDGMQQLWERDMKARATVLKKKQSAMVKKGRIAHKTARIEEQQERKQWAKRQRIVHQYGEDDDSDDSDNDTVSETPPTIAGQQLADNAMLVICEDIQETSEKGKGKGKGKKVQKPCKCGSTTHQRISFRDCPLHK